jgi:hypothetical protein
MAAEDREKQFERALSRHLSSASPDSRCPDAEILAAYHERTLSTEEMMQWKDHIVSCARCQESLALVEQTENLPAEDWEHTMDLVATDDVVLRRPSLTPTRAAAGKPASADLSSAGPVAGMAAPLEISQRKRRPPLRWIVPLGAVAAAVLVWIGVGEFRTGHLREMQTTQIAENRAATPAPQLTAPNPTPQPPALQDSAPDYKNETVILPKVAAPSPSRIAPKPSAPMLADREAPVGSASPNELARKDKAAAPAGVMGGVVHSLPASSAPAPPVNGRVLTPGTTTDAAGRALNAATSAASSAPATGASQTNAPAAAPAKEESKKAQDQVVAVNSAAQTLEVQGSSNLQTLDAQRGAAQSAFNLNLVQLAQASRLYIVAPGEKHAWRVGNAGKIERSTDRGKTWKLQSSGVTADLTGGSATSDKNCWVIGRAGTLLVTTDGGKNWKQISTPISGDLGGVHATDVTHVSIWDVPNRQSYQTNDGGVTWTRMANE